MITPHLKKNMNKIKIVSGFSEVYEVEELIKRGADELFCGILRENKDSTINCDLNHRPGSKNNLKNLDELKESLKIAHKYNKKIYLAINEIEYNLEQIEYIKQLIYNAIKINIDGFIASNLTIIEFISKLKISLAISCTNPCLNSETLEIFKKLNATRIIFPRHLTPNEINELLINSKIESEVFFNEVSYCNNEDAFCSLHGSKNDHRRTCDSFELIKEYNSNYNNLISNNSKFNNEKFNKKINEKNCFNSFDSIYEFNKYNNINYIKVASRTYTSEQKYSYTSFVYKILNIFEKYPDITKQQYRLFCEKLWKKYF